MRTFRSIVAGLFAALMGPTAFAGACDGFTDVDSGNSTCCSAVTYLKDKGITLGCTGMTYCPNDPVTRLQMALLLQRAGQGSSTNSLGSATNFIGSGFNNSTVLFGSVYNAIGGGEGNSAFGSDSFVGAGQNNTASAALSTVGAGSSNTAGVSIRSSPAAS